MILFIAALTLPAMVLGSVPTSDQPAQVVRPWYPFGAHNGSELPLPANQGRPSTFVNNGSPTPIGDFPYQAAILIDYGSALYFICSGVIVSRKKVLTAAHCADFMHHYDHYVAAGVYDLSLGLGNPGSQIQFVKRYKVHHHYVDSATLGWPNDIAMLTLQHKFAFNGVIQRANLAPGGHVSYAGRDCMVSGYGEGNILHSGYQVGLSRQVCRKFWSIYPLTSVNRRHQCSMFYPISACTGDSGGPITCGNKVVGLLSWGASSCDGCTPAVSTSISAMRNWIDRHR